MVDALLIYGAASEAYLGIEGGVNAEGLQNNVGDPDGEMKLMNAEEFGFTSAGVNFDTTNKIFVKFYCEYEFTAYVNGTEVKAEEIGENMYMITTDAITAKQFASDFEFVIEADGDKATLVYSINAYCAAMAKSEKVEMANLAKALYAYGVAADHYN